MHDPSRRSDPPQEIRFCRAPDGVRIAYARHGSGPVLVINTCWLSHLQFDWESPVWRHFLDAFGRFATVIRYDERGHGLSDWDVDDFGLEARIGDLEAVVDDAGLERFALMGMAQGGPPAIAYTARHPERVSRLLFYGSYGATMPDPTDEELELANAFDQMVKVGWARPESAFRRVFTSLMIPGATEEQKSWLDDLQRAAVSAENAYRSRRERAKSDVRTLLPELRVPDARPAFARRPDERLRLESLPGRAHRRGATRRTRQPEPHRAGRRARVAGVARCRRGIHGA